MKDSRISIEPFFVLLRAGLWEKEARLSQYEEMDFSKITQLAEEQSVVGLVAAGIDHVEDVKLPQAHVLQFVGQALMLEQQNQAMNAFIGKLVEKMRSVGIYALLLKGQGVAQCYEKPLWRACGDIDFLLSNTDYEKAKAYLTPLANSIEIEGKYKKHLSMTLNSWLVELHGNQRCGLSARMDKCLDNIQNDIIQSGEVRLWMNGNTYVFLPGADSDVLFVFTHYLKHFYTGGLGLRQICDWCRLLWTYRDSINVSLLENRLRKMGLIKEWKAFGAFAVKYLGIPKEVMPLYSDKVCWKWKTKKICSFVMEVGNMGHNRDRSYHDMPYYVRKACSFERRCRDLLRHVTIFPLNSLRFFPTIVLHGLRSAAKGE